MRLCASATVTGLHETREHGGQGDLTGRGEGVQSDLLKMGFLSRGKRRTTFKGTGERGVRLNLREGRNKVSRGPSENTENDTK